jgi:hypothetical protein
MQGQDVPPGTLFAPGKVESGGARAAQGARETRQRDMTTNRIDQAEVLRQGALGPFRETVRKDRPGESGPSTTAPAAPERTEDRAEISAAARRLMEIHGTLEFGRKAVDDLPVLREDAVAAAKARLEEGYYHSEEVLDKVTDSVKQVFDGLDAL